MNGGTLSELIAYRKQAPLEEREVQLIIQKLAQCLNDIYEKNIMHRDINTNNVMLHFPDLEPTEDELQDPNLLLYMDIQWNKKI